MSWENLFFLHGILALTKPYSYKSRRLESNSTNVCWHEGVTTVIIQQETIYHGNWSSQAKNPLCGPVVLVKSTLWQYNCIATPTSKLNCVFLHHTTGMKGTRTNRSALIGKLVLNTKLGCRMVAEVSFVTKNCTVRYKASKHNIEHRWTMKCRFYGWNALKYLVREFITKRKLCLHIGCGNSNFQEGMGLAGYQVVNVRMHKVY